MRLSIIMSLTHTGLSLIITNTGGNDVTNVVAKYGIYKDFIARIKVERSSSRLEMMKARSRLRHCRAWYTC